MKITATRVQHLALVFSVMVHLLGAGLGLFMRSDSRLTSQGAPFITLQIHLQQAGSTARDKPSAESRTEADKAVDAKSVPKRLIRSKPVPLLEGLTEETAGQLVSQSDDAPKPMQKQEKPEIQRIEILASSPIRALRPAKAAVSETDRANYFSRLQAHIEAHKYYPRRARKQGIEGHVQVSFQLMNNGEIGEIYCSGGHRLLNHAAKKAIKDALPLPPPPDGLILPVKVEFSIYYELNN